MQIKGQLKRDVWERVKIKSDWRTAFNKYFNQDKVETQSLFTAGDIARAFKAGHTAAITPDKVGSYVNDTLDSIIDKLALEKEITLSGFGRLKVRDFGQGKIVTFKASKKAKEIFGKN